MIHSLTTSIITSGGKKKTFCFILFYFIYKFNLKLPCPTAVADDVYCKFNYHIFEPTKRV